MLMAEAESFDDLDDWTDCLLNAYLPSNEIATNARLLLAHFGPLSKTKGDLEKLVHIHPKYHSNILDSFSDCSI